MKNYTWAKGYTYHKLPVYLIDFSFYLFRWWYIRLIKIGYRRVRCGIKITNPKIWKLYEKAITNNIV